MNIAVELYMNQMNRCNMKPVNGHIEVFGAWNNFLFSSDTEQEAENDIKKYIEQKVMTV